jgi:CO/xanthine dehydrogenase Mo-binding subunit
VAPDDGLVTAPNGASAWATIDESGAVHVRVACGAPLDEVVLRSYCVGAAHMALGWVRTEGITVGDDGVPRDLTIRSFGVLRAIDMPVVHVEILTGGEAAGEPVNGSDAVFAAVAAAAWRAAGFSPRWPTMRS